jgi:hypothetical protein
MFAAPVAPVFKILTMLLLSAGAGLPLGLPPLPEDPMLARSAPADCIAYMSLSGTGTPDANSKNQTEQFLAEPEVQQMFHQIERAVVAKIEENSPQQHAAATADAIRWAKKLLPRPVMAFVSSAAVTPQGPDIHGGLMINVGDDIAALKADLEKYQAMLPHPPEKVEISGISCYRFSVRPGAPIIVWGVKDKYVVVGVGEGSFEGILQRANGSVPAWLTALHKQLPVERPATVTYLNVKRIVQQFAPMGGPRARTIIDAAGLGNVTSLEAVSGLDGDGTMNRMLVGIEGEPAGLLSLANGKPLTAQDLSPIPRDANLAVAKRFDLARTMDVVMAMVDKINPQAAEEVNQHLKKLDEHLGIDLRNDVIASLGDVWCAYNSSGEGGLILTGLTAVVKVKDYDRLSAAHAKLLLRAQAAFGQTAPPRARIDHLRFANQDVYFLSANDFPFAPAWCLTHDELIVATFPQQIKACLSRSGSFRSLATTRTVTNVFASGEQPLSLFYFSPRPVLNYLYPIICMGVQMASKEMARNGIDLNVSIIPSAPAIYRHVRPSVTVAQRTPAGIEIISRATVPGSSMGAAAPVAVGLLLPAVSAARDAARRAQSMNNLKQISLAMLNYADAMGTYPPAYIADKKTGKPLLSWRVAILPYVEEQALYNKFHLDEPWDSEHNKPLADTVVAVYRSPGSHTKPPMTNYLSVRGKDTVFPGKEGIRIADITDGTSNTILVVEASDAKAVPWTKPDDFEYNEKQPAAGLAGLWPNVFLAAFCDGSVHAIPTSIDAETLRRLFNRHDSQMIDRSKF